jgi:S-DNA-T family DNA segregation ATPase FtsK/SpoIIIE
MYTWVFYIFLPLLIMVGVGFLIFLFTTRSREVAPHRLDEATGILLFLFAFLMGLSLVSYHETDVYQLSEAHNLAGTIGAVISHSLLVAFGIISWTIPLILVLWGIHKVRRSLVENISSLAILIAVLAFLFSSISSIIKPGSQLSYYPLDGWVGGFFGNLAYRAFGRIGAYFVIVVAGLVTFILTTEITPTALWERRPRRKLRKSRPPKPAPVYEVEEKRQQRPSQLSFIPTLPPETQIDEEYRRTFLSLLSDCEEIEPKLSRDLVEERAAALEQKLSDFEIKGKVVGFSSGPLITRYEFEPAPGIKISRIVALADDLALSMKSGKIRIVAPIPGKSAVGIEIPNPDRGDVSLKEVLKSEKFTQAPSRLLIALGKGIAGEPYFADLASMPHLLIAGATGSGKSVCINSIIASILFRVSEREVRFIMLDPKRLELPVYNGIPHLVRPVITNSKESLEVLQSIIDCMEVRYSEFAKAGVRDIEGFNQKVLEGKPYIVLIIDELADLMLTAPSQIEEKLTRLAQMSRAVGIHLILATQRPSVDVITGLIKANFPARIAFQVASKTDSRTILDMNGAEKLLGRGDMLFLPPGRGEPVRVHGTYISTEEAKRIATLLTKRYAAGLLRERFGDVGGLVDQFIKENLMDSIAGGGQAREVKLKLIAERIAERTNADAENVLQLLVRLGYYQPIEEGALVRHGAEEKKEEGEVDELFKEAGRLVVRHNLASVSLLQRRFKIGYARAGRIIDQLEQAGVVGPYEGSKAREVLVDQEELQRILREH